MTRSENISSSEQIHKKVKTRQKIYTIVFLLMALSALYQVIFIGANLFSMLGGFVVGGLLGAFVFSRMTRLLWHEQQGQVILKMDLTSVIVLVSYVIFIFIRSTLLDRRFDGSTLDAVSASLVSGIMLGQLYTLHSTIQRLLGLHDKQGQALKEPITQLSNE